MLICAIKQTLITAPVSSAIVTAIAEWHTHRMHLKLHIPLGEEQIEWGRARKSKRQEKGFAPTADAVVTWALKVITKSARESKTV